MRGPVGNPRKIRFMFSFLVWKFVMIFAPPGQPALLGWENLRTNSTSRTQGTTTTWTTSPCSDTRAPVFRPAAPRSPFRSSRSTQLPLGQNRRFAPGAWSRRPPLGSRARGAQSMLCRGTRHTRAESPTTSW